jgi:hypothetical protein
MSYHECMKQYLKGKLMTEKIKMSVINAVRNKLVFKILLS